MSETREKLLKKLEELNFYHAQLAENKSEKEIQEIIRKLERDREIIKNIYKLEIFK